jgi:prevent-host-death family protein
MKESIGVDKARTKLGQLAKEVAAGGEAVFLTHRGEPIVVLVSKHEYLELTEKRRVWARKELRWHLGKVRQSVMNAGLDTSIVNEAIAWAKEAERVAE